MSAKKFYLLIVIALVTGLIPQKNAYADMGPKPSFQFQFIQDISIPKLILGKWTLISCPDSECQNIDGMLRISGDEFECEENNCFARINPLTYQGNGYFQIEAMFSDDKLRRSNVFEKSYIDAKYKVAIQDQSLSVEELKGSDPSPLSNPLNLFFLSPLLIPAGCLIVIVAYFMLVVIRNHFRTTEKDEATEIRLSKRKTITPLWIVITFFVLLGLMLDAYTFIFTIIIEFLLALVYLKYARIPTKKILYGVLLANVFTQPIFVAMLKRPYLQYKFMNIVVLEIIVWLVEAAIVNKVQDKQLPFKNITVLIFVLNAVSFGVGLLLPI